MTKRTSVLWREACLVFYVGGVSHVPKILVMGQTNGSFWRKKKSNQVVTNFLFLGEQNCS
jgi:hypothetical protein